MHLGLFLQRCRPEAQRSPLADERTRRVPPTLAGPFPINAAVVLDFAHAKAAHVQQQAQTRSPVDDIIILTVGARRRLHTCLQGRDTKEVLQRMSLRTEVSAAALAGTGDFIHRTRKWRSRTPDSARLPRVVSPIGHSCPPSIHLPFTTITTCIFRHCSEEHGGRIAGEGWEGKEEQEGRCA